MTDKNTAPAVGAHTMVARFCETMPEAEDRPIRDNAAVREEATRRILPAVSAAIPGVPLDQLEIALQAATRWANDPKEIIAKLTHRLKIQPSDALIQSVSGLSYEIDVCHEMMVKAWVRVRRIAAKFEEGDEVIATLQQGLFRVRSIHGVVVSIDPDLAQYTIKARENGRPTPHVVAFEDVVRRGEEVTKNKAAAADAED